MSSRPNLSDPHARIVGGRSIIRVSVPPMMEVWGLKNWLLSLRLSECYTFFQPMDFDEIMSLTEHQVYTRLSPGLVYKIIDSVDIVKAQQKLIQDMKRKLFSGTSDIRFVISELGRVLPSQFEALLGRISTILVEVMQLVYFRLPSVKPLSEKRDCQHDFYMLCLRGELSDSFMEADKYYLKKWRVAYQTERKLFRQKAKLLKK